jgi:hypothetical protein
MENPQFLKFQHVLVSGHSTKNQLQTCSLELKIVQKTLKNCDKELIIIKGQMNRVQHENQNLSNKLNEA